VPIISPMCRLPSRAWFDRLCRAPIWRTPALWCPRCQPSAASSPAQPQCSASARLARTRPAWQGTRPTLPGASWCRRSRSWGWWTTCASLSRSLGGARRASGWPRAAPWARRTRLAGRWPPCTASLPSANSWRGSSWRGGVPGWRVPGLPPRGAPWGGPRLGP